MLLPKPPASAAVPWGWSWEASQVSPAGSEDVGTFKLQLLLLVLLLLVLLLVLLVLLLVLLLLLLLLLMLR